ncbi:unnamed protein product, partial [Mesorhabditis belari]|uniref:Protein kinase domain-containing protein n=1 Tax=Mesorhabditis belari TaxID=2138241 RepID=A0AAF3FDC4_9BILA
MFLNEITSCGLFQFSYSFSLWSPLKTIHCCQMGDCNRMIDAISWDDVTLSLHNDTDNDVPYDPDDHHGMKDSFLQSLMMIPEARRKVDSVFLITDYGVDMMEQEYLDQLYPFIGMFHIIVLGGNVAKYYPNPIIAEDALELVRTVEIPAMCAPHELGVVTGGNVNIFHRREHPTTTTTKTTKLPLLVTSAHPEAITDLCPELRNVTLSPELPIDFHIFVAFSEKMGSSDAICVREMFHSLLNLAHLETNSGTITMHGPRAQTFVTCEWADYEKCLEATDKLSMSLVQVRTPGINDADLDFAPDVLNFLRSEAIRAHEQKRILIVIISDFISLEFPLNSLFFQAAMSQQNIELTMAVVTEWNRVTKQDLYKYYGNLTSTIYEIPSFQNLSMLLGVWTPIKSTSSPTTTTATTTANPTINGSTTQFSNNYPTQPNFHKTQKVPPTTISETTITPTSTHHSTSSTANNTSSDEQDEHKHPKILYILLGSICGLGLIVLGFYLIYFIIKKNRFLIRENKMLTLQHSLRLSDDDEEGYQTKSSSITEMPLGVNWILSELQKDPWEMDRQKIIVGRQVGRGTSGVVYKGALIGKSPVEEIHKKSFFAFQFDKQAVAIKMMPLHFEETKRHAFIEEIEILKQLSPHPNICGLLGCVSKFAPLCMVIEFAVYGDLKRFLQTKKIVECPGTACAVHSDQPCLKTLITFCWQIADGLKFLHSNRLLHRDLAARNILLNQSGNVQISDFGLAVWIDRPERNKMNRLPIKWTAIETLRYGEFSTFSDIWSLGVCLWEILSMGKEPYSHVSNEEILTYLACGKRLKHPKKCPQQVWSLLELCWSEHPRDRPTLDALRADFGRILEDFTAGYGYLDLQNATFNNITFKEEKAIIGVTSIHPSGTHEIIASLLQHKPLDEDNRVAAPVT